MRLDGFFILDKKDECRIILQNVKP